MSRILGKDSKTIGAADLQDIQTEDDSDTLAWRNRYLAARIKFLDNQLKKNNFGKIGYFDLPQDVESGGSEHLAIINEILAARVGYLEDILKAR
ncbi:MAG: hypothetical protein ABJN69_14580 [Hellea sp.]